MTICETCGWELHVSDWPFCGRGRDHRPAVAHIVRDEIPGGFVQENFGDAPETFYSWSAMRRRAEALGLQPYVRRLEQIKESDYIDAQTLANAAALVGRQSRVSASDGEAGRLTTMQFTVREIERPPRA